MIFFTAGNQNDSYIYDDMPPNNKNTDAVSSRTAKNPIRMLSGPVSVRTYDTAPVGGGGTLYLLGDVHFSNDHACVPCRSDQGCATIMTFIDHLASSKRSLDVFVELPYVPRNGDHHHPRARALSALDHRFGTSSATSSRGKVREGGSDVYVGVLGSLYKKYRDHIYVHHVVDDLGGDSMRVHFADIRLEPNVNALLRPDWIVRHVPSLDALRDVMRAFMFATDFTAAVAAAVGPEGASHVSRTSLASSPNKCHKVAKQFLAAPDGDMKSAARAHLDERLEELIDILRADIGGFPAEPPKQRSSDVYYKEWLESARFAKVKAHQWGLARLVQFGLRVLVMDAYLIFRVMRFATRGDAVVYVGDSHADLYARFLEGRLGLTPRSQHLAQTQRSRGGRERRCVEIS